MMAGSFAVVLTAWLRCAGQVPSRRVKPTPARRTPEAHESTCTQLRTMGVPKHRAVPPPPNSRRLINGMAGSTGNNRRRRRHTARGGSTLLPRPPAMSELFPWTRVDGYQKPYPLPRSARPSVRPPAQADSAHHLGPQGSAAAATETPAAEGGGGRRPAFLRTPDSALKPASARVRPA
eukprot:COSAG01_NODE_24022_length_793_cov_1.502882_1_plen_177_part_10